MEILYSELPSVAPVLFLVVLVAFWLFEYFENGGGPPGSGWCLYTDEAHAERLNERMRKTKQELTTV